MDTGKSAFPEAPEREKSAVAFTAPEVEDIEPLAPPPPPQKRRTAYLAAKRAFDIVFSSVLLLLLLLVMLVVPLLIVLDSRGGVFYTQKRIGKGGKPFYIYKFRSMRKDADSLIQSFSPEQRAEYEANYKLSDDFRITRVGKVLRKTNIDELP